MCILTNASCQQEEMSQAIFPYTHGNGRTQLFQTPDGRETTLASGPQDDNKALIKQTSFVV